jgi:hypothetical protein
MTRSLTLDEAAAELRISKRQLQYWLSVNPVDADGVPFYIKIGRGKTFEPNDIDRIRAFLREKERQRLSPRAHSTSNVSTATLAWLATSGSYEDLVRMREREKRKNEAEKAKQPRRRVRLPRAKPKG